MNKFKIELLKDTIDFPIDYFFCCASFEERCYSIAGNLDIQQIKNAVLCINIDQINSFKGNELKLEEKLPKDRTEKLELDSRNPIKTTEVLVGYLSKLKDEKNTKIVIDITTFTREVLLILYRLLKAFNVPPNNVYYLYNNASDYSIHEKNIEEKWLSVGNKEIRSVIGYSGFMSPLKKNLLIVLVGFEPERTMKLIESYEPNQVSLGVGNDYCSDKLSMIDLNRQRHKQIAENIPNVSTFEFSVTDPYETKDAIIKELDKYPMYNVIIAPMNNKVSTLGAALLACEKNEVQLCYVPAMYYNIEGYSSPGSMCYMFQLNK